MRRAIAVILMMAASARAQPQSEADRLFEAGRDLARRGDYAAACESFEQSFALDPAVGTQLNLADCDEHLGRLRAAWERYLAAALQSERAGESKRADYARQHADAVAARLATIVVDVGDPTLPGLAITIAGRRVATQAEIRDRIDPGDVEIVATVPGQPDFTAKVRAEAGQTAVVAVPAPRHAGPAPMLADPRTPRIHLAWGLAATAGAAAIASLAIGSIARGDYNTATTGTHCAQEGARLVCDGPGADQVHHAQTLANVSTIVALGAIALGAASGYVYLTAPPVTPIATRTTIGLAITRRF